MLAGAQGLCEETCAGAGYGIEILAALRPRPPHRDIGKPPAYSKWRIQKPRRMLGCARLVGPWITFMRILIVEDEPHWQHRIREVADASEHCTDRRSVRQFDRGTVRDQRQGVRRVDRRSRPARRFGHRAIRAARRLRPEADILVATVFDDERSVVSAICAGATGYVVKDFTAPEWLSAMTELRAGNSPISPKIARHILRRVQQPSIFLPDARRRSADSRRCRRARPRCFASSPRVFHWSKWRRSFMSRTRRRDRMPRTSTASWKCMRRRSGFRSDEDGDS